MSFTEKYRTRRKKSTILLFIRKGASMKVIVAGSRSIVSYEIVKKAIDKAVSAGLVVTEIVSGNANGVDKLGERWANENNIPIKKFIPEWSVHGKKAGMLRNCDMGNYADALVMVWDGESRGSAQMLEYTKSKGLNIHLEIIK